MLYTEWANLAQELRLLISPGSDRHGPYVPGHPRTSVPVMPDDHADVRALLAALRAAGD